MHNIQVAENASSAATHKRKTPPALPRGRFQRYRSEAEVRKEDDGTVPCG